MVCVCVYTARCSVERLSIEDGEKTGNKMQQDVTSNNSTWVLLEPIKGFIAMVFQKMPLPTELGTPGTPSHGTHCGWPLPCRHASTGANSKKVFFTLHAASPPYLVAPARSHRWNLQLTKPLWWGVTWKSLRSACGNLPRNAMCGGTWWPLVSWWRDSADHSPWHGPTSARTFWRRTSVLVKWRYPTHSKWGIVAIYTLTSYQKYPKIQILVWWRTFI